MGKDILIFGNGFLGNRIHEEIDSDITNVKIYNYYDAENEIDKYNPKVVINCIGDTGINNVDDCEKAPAKTLNSNVFVPIMLAEACIRRNIYFVHISSGCIYHYDYEKDNPIDEYRNPDFFDLFYSRSKMYSERVLDILTYKYNILIARMRIPLDNVPHPKNILTKLIKFKKAIDIPNSVSYIPDFIDALEHLIINRDIGIFNIVNKGGLRYPALLDTYKAQNPLFTYEIIDYKKLPTPRTNLLLSTRRLDEVGFQMRHINDVLDECVFIYIKQGGYYVETK